MVCLRVQERTVVASNKPCDTTLVHCRTCSSIYLISRMTQSPLVCHTVSGESEEHFDQAMEFGSVECESADVLVNGAAGSGKTHTISNILDREPPAKRVSTSCSSRPIRTMKVGVEGNKLKELEEDDMSEMVAGAVEDVALGKYDPASEHFGTTKSVESEEGGEKVSGDMGKTLPVPQSSHISTKSGLVG